MMKKLKSRIEKLSPFGTLAPNLKGLRRPLPFFLALWIVTTLPLAGDAAGKGDEQWLRYLSSSSRSSGPNYSTRQVAAPEKEAPEGVALPEFSGTRVHHVRWVTPMTPVGYVALAYDAAPGNTANQLLFIDRDCDGSLADEEPITSTQHDRNWTMFGFVPIVFPTENGPVTYHLDVQVYRFGGDDNLRFYFRAGGWYEGLIRIEEKEYKCILVDYNSNGTFNDSGEIFHHSDRITIGTKEGFESYWLGKYIQIDGTLFTAAAEMDGAFVTVERAENVPLGRVAVPADVCRLSLAGKEGHIRLDLPSDQPSVPAGNWCLEEWWMSRLGDDGRKWTLKGRNTPRSADVVIRENQSNSIDLGEPVTASLEVTAKKGAYDFDQKLRGRLGEKIYLDVNGKRAPAPRLLITSADGTYKEELTFKYG